MASFAQVSDVAIKPLVYGVSDATKPQFKGLRNKKRTHRIFRILILVIFLKKEMLLLYTGDLKPWMESTNEALLITRGYDNLRDQCAE